MNIALLGFAAEGRAAFEYWNRDDNEITICDRNVDLELPSGVQGQLGDDYLKNLGRFDLIVRTPALHPRMIIEANPESPAISDKVTTVSNEFLRVCPTKNVIGVTGTKGKGTTSTLITKMLEATGKRVHLGGNIGIPALDLLKADIQTSDYVVLEMSNFQLIDVKQSPPTAVCLLVVPEHLDWHTDLPEYLRAKQQLFVHQKGNDRAIYFAGSDLSKQIASASPGVLTEYFAPPGAHLQGENIVINDTIICQTSDVKLLGAHNLQNVCAAITAVWPIIQDAPTIKKTLSQFIGLPFRIEPRREVHGIRYYNDSFATAPDASMAAFNAVPGPKVMILGGFDRNLPLEEWVMFLSQHAEDIRKLVIIGASAERLKHALLSVGFDNFVIEPAKTMPEIVHTARRAAHKGDSVILSPGFASFGMFKNFEERGIKFNEAVEAL